MLREDLKTEFDALLPGRSTEAGATRRTALKAALGVGYAASALPVMAQTAIKTPADGLTSGEVTIDVNGFKMPCTPVVLRLLSPLPCCIPKHGRC